MKVDEKYLNDCGSIAKETVEWIIKGLNGEEGGCKDSKEFSKRMIEIDRKFDIGAAWMIVIMLKDRPDYYVHWKMKTPIIRQRIDEIGRKIITDSLLYFIVEYITSEGMKVFSYPDISELEANPTCPEEGEFIGWKLIFRDLEDGCMPYYAKILIPADAKRTRTFTNKCRCSKAKVLEIVDIHEDPAPINARYYSFYDESFEYKVGEWVYPDEYDGIVYNECSHGIHFFMSMEECIKFYLDNL